MPSIRHLILIGLVVGLSACGGKSISEEQKQYYSDMDMAAQKIQIIYSYTNGSRYSKPGYTKHLSELTPEVIKVLKKYKSTPHSQEDSYQSLVKSIENYVQAQKLWDNSKGLDLVNRRISEGGNWLSKTRQFLDQERYPDKYKALESPDSPES